MKINIRMPKNSASIPKYGLGAPFKECGLKDFKRKKMFQESFSLDEFVEESHK